MMIGKDKLSKGMTKADVLKGMAEFAAEGLVEVQCKLGHVLSAERFRAGACPTCGPIDRWSGAQYRYLGS